MKLLLVEDSPADARLIRETLKDSVAGAFQVEQATRLDAALERLRQERFDVVLLDLHLPDSQGMETLTRAQEICGGVPLIILTGLDNEDFALEAVRAGAQDYLVKGRFDSQLLVRAIRYAIQRKQAEEASSRLAAIVESSHDGILGKTLDGTILTWNQGAERLYGYTAAEAVGQSIMLVVPPDRESEIRELLQRIAEGARIENHESIRRCKDGSLVHVSIAMSPIRDARGNAIGASTISRDITKSKQAEQEIRRLNADLELRVAARTVELRTANDQLRKEVAERRQAEEAVAEAKAVAETRLAQLRTTLDNLAEAVYVCDPTGRPLLANPAFLRLTGCDISMLAQDSQSIAAQFPLHELDGTPARFEDRPSVSALRGEIVSGRVFRLPGQPDGEKIVRYNAAPVRDAQGNILMAVLSIEDITASKQAEAALVRSEKLASVGRMAASIAHEINNPLAAVMNAIFIASENLDSPRKVREALDLADEELRRIANLTRQTLGFYRESSAATPLSVNDVLDSAVDLLKSKIKSKHANIRKQYDAEVEMLGIAGELRQVFSNLLANSLDAIEEGGTVSLTVAPARSATGPAVTVTVADNGKGIEPGAMSHVFEPFFTTKQTIGTGLGLWICKQLVDKHEGCITIESATDGQHRGTTISLVLPLDAGSAMARKQVDAGTRADAAAAGRGAD